MMVTKHKQPRGRLIIIGGHEDHDHGEAILKEVVKAADGGKLVLVTVASQKPEEAADLYIPLFKDLGIKDIEHLDIFAREDGHKEEHVNMLRDAAVIFFTGGDQLRITSQLGDTPVYQCMQQLYLDGTTIAGTSAGAAVMPETMLIAGTGDKSADMSVVGMAPGLGLIEQVVIDSHFAERGRIGRLLGAVAQNPANLGIGIDEDTAIIVERAKQFRVIGAGAVYVLDGSTLTYSSLSEAHSDGVLSIYDVRLHVLTQDDRFDLIGRRPLDVPEIASDGKSGQKAS